MGANRKARREAQKADWRDLKKHWRAARAEARAANGLEAAGLIAQGMSPEKAQELADLSKPLIRRAPTLVQHRKMLALREAAPRGSGDPTAAEAPDADWEDPDVA